MGEAPGAPEVQGGLGGLLGLLRRPDLLGPSDRRPQDHLYRPLPPRDLEALQAPATNRRPSSSGSPLKPRTTKFFGYRRPPISESGSAHSRRQVLMKRIRWQTIKIPSMSDAIIGRHGWSMLNPAKPRPTVPRVAER